MEFSKIWCRICKVLGYSEITHLCTKCGENGHIKENHCEFCDEIHTFDINMATKSHVCKLCNCRNHPWSR